MKDLKQLKQIHIYLPVELHKRLKLQLVKNDTTITDVIMNFIKDYVTYNETK